MALQWNTVSTPFAKGIQPSTRGRVLDQLQLQTAQNCFYRLNSGPEKRFGHASRPVLSSAPPFGSSTAAPAAPAPREPFTLANPNLPAAWLHGFGLTNAEDELSISTEIGFEYSPDPRPGLLFGQSERDNEITTWDGHRLFGYAAQQPVNWSQVQNATTKGPAVMPALRAEPFAKTAAGQNMPDAADNGVVRTAAWLIAAGTVTTLAWMTADSATGTVLNSASEVLQAPKYVRVICVGPWTHMLVTDTTATELLMRSFHQDTPSTIVSRSLGTISATKPVFDVKKLSESIFYVARLGAGVTNITILALNSDGSTISTWVPDIDGGEANSVSIAINREGLLGIMWDTWDTVVASIRFNEYTAGGLARLATAVEVFAPTINSVRFTLSDEYTYLTDFDRERRWMCFVEDLASLIYQVRSYRVIVGNTSAAVALQSRRYRTRLASHGFRVGERAYVWLGNQQPINGAVHKQATWFLNDHTLQPIGKLDFGVANIDQTTSQFLASVNWTITDSAHPAKDRLVFNGCFGYRQRVPSAAPGAQPQGIFAEPSIRFYQLDFLPRLRSAQAGRCTYYAGAQLWQYDGLELNEAGFHTAPEGLNLAPTTAAGALTPSSAYQYRFDLCHKNAQNEEIRSWSIAYTVNLGAGNNRVTATIPHTPMTRREDAYILVYRTEANKTAFYLVSSRNPADAGLAANRFVLNDRALASYTFVDDLADTAIIGREYHPSNAGASWLEPLPAPACEIVAAGKDRLWLAGGELAPGEVAPSRLFQPGETPAFTPALNIQVDRGFEPITALGFVSNLGVIFRRRAVYVVEGEGPNNVLGGEPMLARLALADVGAVSQDGVALASPGLFFQSVAGIRLLSPSGQLLTGAAGQLAAGTGHDVDVLAEVGNYAAAVVVPEFNHVRWYSRDPMKPTLVYDYEGDIWTTWTTHCVGASYWHPGHVPILTRADGQLWKETPGLYMDGDYTYEMVVKTAWFHAANMGDWQKFRRFVVYGEAVDPLRIRVRYFYDERPFHSEEQFVEYIGEADSQFNTSTWGDGSWGTTGSFGDENNPSGQSGLWFRDGLFKLRKMPQKMSCSVFALEFSDLGGSNAGFIPNVLALELGTKPGLDRVPGPVSFAQ